MIDRLRRWLTGDDPEPVPVATCTEAETRYEKVRQEAEARIIRAERTTERIARMPSWEDLYRDRGR